MSKDLVVVVGGISQKKAIKPDLNSAWERFFHSHFAEMAMAILKKNI
jgi:hypothetical protein